MKLGFTGTQLGMTDAQKAAVAAILAELKPAELHHGDCVGADADCHALFGQPERTVLHPPTNASKRAFCRAGTSLPPLPYLDRNKRIVEASDYMVACTAEDTEQLRSGTWSTVRYAKRQRKPLTIVFPDGSTQEFRER